MGKEKKPHGREERRYRSADDEYTRVSSAAYGNGETAIVSFVGYSVPHTSAPLQKLSEAYARQFGATFHLVETASKKFNGKNKMQYEVEAAHERVQEIVDEHRDRNGQVDLYLSGHSRGAIIATGTQHLFEEENPDNTLNPLTLFNPKGITEQGLAELSGAVTLDLYNAIVDSANQKNGDRWRALLTTADIYGEVGIVQLDKLRESRMKYPRRILDELRPCQERSPYMSLIKSPVLIFTGEKDPLALPGHIIPDGEQVPTLLQLPTLLGKHIRKRDFLKLPTEVGGAVRNLFGKDKNGFILDLEERSAYLQENYFTSSASVLMLVAQGKGHSFSAFDPETIARITYEAIEHIASGSKERFDLGSYDQKFI